MMLAKFGEDATMLAIATGQSLDASASAADKVVFAQTQARIYCIILGSLAMPIANRFLEHKLVSDVWRDLVARYEGTADPQCTSLEVRKLLAKLNGSRGLRGSMETLLTTMLMIRDRLAVLKHVVQDESMKTALLRALPAHEAYKQVSGAVRYGVGATATLERVREMIRLAEAELQAEVYERHVTDERAKSRKPEHVQARHESRYAKQQVQRIVRCLRYDRSSDKRLSEQSWLNYSVDTDGVEAEGVKDEERKRCKPLSHASCREGHDCASTSRA